MKNKKLFVKYVFKCFFYVNEGDKGGYTNLQTQAAKTITPTKSAQTAVTTGRYTTGVVTVAAIPD